MADLMLEQWKLRYAEETKRAVTLPAPNPTTTIDPGDW
jgi:hypothetical protein